MFSLFHRRKLKYNKGQLTPFFIVILVVIIIMALVTVNLSKIATTRTEASNSADAAGLAAGSVMANVFNQIAQANSYQYIAYWMYYGLVSISFTIATVLLITAHVQATAAHVSASSAMSSACASPCTAKVLAASAARSVADASRNLLRFVNTMRAIIIKFLAYTIGSYVYYLIIRDIASLGREKAIEAGHGFSFSNSGAGAKLKPGSMATPEGGEDANNYKDSFTDFLDGLGSAEEYTYSWTDGDARGHRVVSRIKIDPVDTYELKVMALPTLVILALLQLSITLAGMAIAELATAAASYAAATASLATACHCQTQYYINQACCGPYNPGCCAAAAVYLACWQTSCMAAITSLGAGMVATTGAITTIIIIYPVILAAWLGMLPGWTITDDGNILTVPLLFTICWIEDVVHNRLVRAEADQHHAGASVGLWNVNYPPTYSFCVVDFRGDGKIFDGGNWDILHHDASIQSTDHLDGE